jgi:ABC-type hemin transport system ATPase subunit
MNPRLRPLRIDRLKVDPTALRRRADLPTAGTVAYRGTPLTGANPGATMVFQSSALLPWLTVQQNVEPGLEARGVPEAERAERALAAIDTTGLDGFEAAYPKELSGDMRQRVDFARAIVKITAQMTRRRVRIPLPPSPSVPVDSAPPGIHGAPDA